MADIFSKDKRSSIMMNVKSSGNKSTELRMIEIFKKFHITGWCRNYKLPGKPDFVFPKNRVVIFVDGCFWHGHNCRNLRPTSNREYWEKKRQYNKKHDQDINEELISRDWHVFRFWECEIRKNRIATRVLDILKSWNA